MRRTIILLEGTHDSMTIYTVNNKAIDKKAIK